MSSDGTSAEKEKNEAEEEKEEEALKDLSAPAEELAASAPPAVREVPAHLQKQAVREIIHSKRKLLTFTDVSSFTDILSILTDPRGV